MDHDVLKSEIDAMAACWVQLSKFDHESRSRMLRWLTARSEDSATPWEQPDEAKRRAREAKEEARYAEEEKRNA